MKMTNTAPPNDTPANGSAPNRPTIALSASCTTTCPTCDSITGTASVRFSRYCGNQFRSFPFQAKRSIRSAKIARIPFCRKFRNDETTAGSESREIRQAARRSQNFRRNDTHPLSFPFLHFTGPTRTAMTGDEEPAKPAVPTAGRIRASVRMKTAGAKAGDARHRIGRTGGRRPSATAP